jgi:hypothetical protein
MSKCLYNGLVGYTDASWANDRDSRKSFGGYVMCYGGVPISWSCTKQKCVALSTMEAEFVALVDCVKEAYWVSEIIKRCNVTNDKCPVPLIYSDSLSAIDFTKHSVENNRSKHINIRYYFVRDWLSQNLFELRSVQSSSNLADIFTKCLPVKRFNLLTDNLFYKE